MTLPIAEYVQRAADRSGFARENYVEADLPTQLGSVTIMPFFGDLRSQFVMSSLLLHRYLGEVKKGRYFIMASWPGLAGLFPYVDEYWGIKDSSILPLMWAKTEGFANTDERGLTLRRSLREYFSDIVTFDSELKRYYNAGLTKDFFETFGHVHVSLPSLRSLRPDMSKYLAGVQGYKVFIHPVVWARNWHQQRNIVSRVDRKFWIDLCERLLRGGITPVVWQNYATYDISTDLTNRCQYVTESNVYDVLAMMRACTCVLDVFSGLNRYAAVARCPFVVVEDRHKFVNLKEYELDDLCVLNKDYKYLMSYPTMLESGKWTNGLVDLIMLKLDDMLPKVNRDKWPNTAEYTAVQSYGSVRNKKTKRIGSHFIKIPKV
jgi:hypothetical protein